MLFESFKFKLLYIGFIGISPVSLFKARLIYGFFLISIAFLKESGILKLYHQRKYTFWIFNNKEDQSRTNILIFILSFRSQKNLVFTPSFPQKPANPPSPCKTAPWNITPVKQKIAPYFPLGWFHIFNRREIEIFTLQFKPGSTVLHYLW